MLIGDKYKVEVDKEGLNIVFYEKHIARSGREVWRAKGFFNTAKGALDFLIDQEVNRTGLKDLETVIRKVDELHNLIAALPNSQLPALKTLQGATRALKGAGNTCLSNKGHKPSKQLVLLTGG